MTKTSGSRFEIEEAVSRQGAHRAKPNAVLSLLPFLAVGIVALSVVALAWSLFGRGASQSGTQATAGVPAASIAVLASSGASGASSSASKSAAATASGASGAASSVGDSSAALDKALRLDYYNGTSAAVSGQARKAEARLRSAGWTNTGALETWTGPAVTMNTVFYADAAQLASARAVVKVLGGGTVKLNTAYATTSSLAVVVGDNFQP